MSSIPETQASEVTGLGALVVDPNYSKLRSPTGPLADIHETNFPLGWASAVEDLASKVKEENWRDTELGNFGVLANYLEKTFQRISELELIVENDQWGLWHTGLYVEHTEPLYALWQRNPEKGEAAWTHVDWVEDTDSRVDLLAVEDSLAAWYTDSVKELVWDPSLELTSNFDKLVKKHGDLFPEVFPKSGHTRRLVLSVAIEEARLRANSNWRLPQPIYERDVNGKGTIQLMLPLMLGETDGVNLVLVVDQQGETYKGNKLISLTQARREARVVVPPIVDWLDSL
jgi:hypothetical protein